MHKLPEQQFKTENDEGLYLKRLLGRVLFNWHWFALSLIGCIILSVLYVRFKTPIYKINARVLVNDEKKGAGVMGGGDILGDLGGLIGAKSTVDNEAEILKTKFLMEKVVRDLNLNITYYRKDIVKNVALYQSPFEVKVIAAVDTITPKKVSIKILDKNKLSFSSEDLDSVITFDRPFHMIEVGLLQITRNQDVPVLNTDYSFTITSIDAKVAELMEELSVGVKNKLITIVDLSLKHPIPKKGEDVLNKLIQNYVEENIKDKNEVADSTVKFIHNRLTIIGNELGDLEGSIQGFKQNNNLADMSEQAKLLVQTTSQYVSELSKVETQISILEGLQQYLKDDTKNKRVLPSSLIPADMVFNGAVEKYNSLTLERARKLIGLTEKNPSIVLVDNEIANARADIEANLQSTLNGLIITRNRINDQIKGAEGQVRSVPEIERNYLNLARQQQIKQELYIFLMQKSEETAISKTSNTSNSKTIDPPKAEVKPISPKKSMIYLMGLIAGIGIPFSLIYLKELLNDKIQNREDITNSTTVPIIGEISRGEDNDNLIVANNSRAAISEQFRAIRTNLSFFFKSTDKKVILITSSMAGEGKSFIAINLGNILALSNKMVLLMELDLRKPGLSVKLKTPNTTGFTSYIIDPELRAECIIKPLSIHPNLFIITSGPIPPNPAEMLLSSRTKTLMEELKAQFDYIIIDAPPVGVVTDAQLVSEYADFCMYIVRQDYTMKKQLNIVNELHQSSKMEPMGIVLNDIDASKGHGYGYGYGYGYGEDFKPMTKMDRLRQRFNF